MSMTSLTAAPGRAATRSGRGVVPAPRHSARATRDSGRRTRSALLDAGTRLFAARGMQDVSLTEIAAQADAFPSQVTYYFGSKEALFVEAACREVLHLGTRVETAGRTARSRAASARVMAETALSSPALLAFAEALLLARQRPTLEPLVARTLDRLHAEGARAWSERAARQGWPVSAPADAVARGFWAVILGLVLERAGSGDAFDLATAEAAVLATLSVRYSPPSAKSRQRRP
jgi:AcrR family transcriptional regulator